MNVLLLATVLPSIVNEVGGAALMSWPSTAYLASSIVAATCTGLLTAAIGARLAFCAGAALFGVAALVCAFAPAMGQIVAGRFVQGFGGGVLAAAAYVLVRGTFPEPAWPRVIGLLSGVWSVSILAGPLVGGLFARSGHWRGAFFAVAAAAAVLVVGAARALPGVPAGLRAPARVPGGRIALICGAIAAMSVAAIVETSLGRGSLIALAIAALVVALRVDRAATVPLLPSDAFSLRSPSGVGLWIALLLSIAFSPLNIYAPIFLQILHGFDPLAAGYAVAGGSAAWTIAAVAVAGLSNGWPARLMIAGPFAIALGLLGLAGGMPSGPVVLALLGIVLMGGGIGACWAFAAQRIMSAPRKGEENVSASSVPTVQQTGYALGAALAGLVANAVGFSVGRDTTGVVAAAFWVPASFVAAGVVAGVMGLRLSVVTRRTAAAEASG